MTNPYAPPQAVVQDIVDLGAAIVLAERATRRCAALLHGLVFGLMVYGPFVVAAIAAPAAQAANKTSGAMTALEVGMSLALVGFIAFVWINIRYMKANGQSIGKKACRIKVVRTDGSAASLSRLIWLRNVLNGIIGLVPLYGIVDMLFIFGEARRCLHDYIADTIVIKA